MSRLICPSCGTPTAFTPIYITRQDVFDYVIGTNEAAGNREVVQAVMPEFWGGLRYAILCCQACDCLFIAKEWLSRKGWLVVYPIPRKAVHKDIEEPVKSEFSEATLCYAVGAYMACAAMCQITLESLWRDKKVSGLDELRDNGIISPALFEKANEIRLWGNLTKHKPIAEKVTPEDAEQLLTYLEVILNDVYVEPKRLEHLKQKRKRLEG